MNSKEMKSLITLFLFLFVVFNISGCAIIGKKSANGSITQIVRMFSLSDSEKDALVIVGFKTLEDKRPKQDIPYLTSIREKVSEEILNTIRGIQLFDEIHSPFLETDNIVISGEIRKFHWESIDTMISYIPGLNVLPFLGLPSTRVHSEVEIYIEFKNKKANAVILGFVESYQKDKKFNIYNFQSDKAEGELIHCFGVVLNRIREKIIINRNNILEAAKLGLTEPIKPVEVKQESTTPIELVPEVKAEQKTAAEAVKALVPEVKAEEKTAADADKAAAPAKETTQTQK